MQLHFWKPEYLCNQYVFLKMSLSFPKNVKETIRPEAKELDLYFYGTSLTDCRTNPISDAFVFSVVDSHHKKERSGFPSSTLLYCSFLSIHFSNTIDGNNSFLPC